MTAIVISERRGPLQLRADYRALPESLIGHPADHWMCRTQRHTGNHFEICDVIKDFEHTQETIMNRVITVRLLKNPIYVMNVN